MGVKLSKEKKFKLEYGAIKNKLAEIGGEIDLNKVINVIQDIRNSKLPNPAVLANAGSFFKNPEVSIEVFKLLKDGYSEIPNFPAQEAGKVKLSAAWLIDQAGFRGKEFSGVGRRYEKHPLSINKKKKILIDDYGHHPIEILANIRATKEEFPDKKVCMIFQPHRFSRTAQLFDDFVDVLKKVDSLILLDIYH